MSNQSIDLLEFFWSHNWNILRIVKINIFSIYFLWKRLYFVNDRTCDLRMAFQPCLEWIWSANISFSAKTDEGDPICTSKTVFRKFTLQLQKQRNTTLPTVKSFLRSQSTIYQGVHKDTKSLGRTAFDKFNGKNGRNLIPGKSVIAQVVPVHESLVVNDGK